MTPDLIPASVRLFYATLDAVSTLPCRCGHGSSLRTSSWPPDEHCPRHSLSTIPSLAFEVAVACAQITQDRTNGHGQARVCAWCSCGGSVDVASSPPGAALLAHATWAGLHLGRGHSPCDQRTARNARRRQETAQRAARRKEHA